MNKCPICGAELIEGANYCTVCCSKLDEINNTEQANTTYTEPEYVEYSFPQYEDEQENAKPVEVYLGDKVYRQGFSDEVMQPRKGHYPPVVQQGQYPSMEQQQYQQYGAEQQNDTLMKVAKIFMILGTLCYIPLLVGLFWSIPIVSIVFKKINNREKVGVGLGVVTFILVSRVAGILLLLSDSSTNNQQY